MRSVQPITKESEMTKDEFNFDAWFGSRPGLCTEYGEGEE